MAMVDRNISVNAARIRRLSEAASNRIAAGEVIERPAAAVKELVENALDAGARRIGVVIAGGGKTLIRVTDDGAGIAAEDLALALERHATSKIDGSDLENIRSFGFRGEALASMGAVARLEIVSRAAGSSETWSIAAHGGAISPARPAAGGAGTTIELRDLFYAAPARLKFLRTDRAETQAVGDVMRRLAMAAPHVGFTLSDATAGAAREIFAAPVEAGDLFDARLARLRRIMGRAFAENAVAIEAEREGLRLGGWAGLPTFSRGSAAAQHLFVNGRPVRDRLLLGALRGAYADLLHGGRHPAAALYIDCAPERVDVNVHPAKTEVRFREPGVARGLVVAGVRHALAEAGHRASTTVGAAALGAFHPEGAGASAAGSARPAPGAGRWRGPDRPGAALREAAASFFAPDAADAATVGAGVGAGAGSESGGDPAGSADQGADGALSARVESGEVERAALARPLGAARAQLHETYIVAQTEDGIVIVDQHAAHERLVYERLKAARAAGGVARQALLIPEVVELGGDAERVLDIADDLAELGLAVEPFGAGAVCVRETPALLGPCDAAGLLRDVADELADLGATTALTARIDAVLSRIACHGSVRAGRRMGAVEMNALLREMEATPLSGQCNHGRPTYVSLRLSEIETLFGRR